MYSWLKSLPPRSSARIYPVWNVSECKSEKWKQEKKFKKTRELRWGCDGKCLLCVSYVICTRENGWGEVRYRGRWIVFTCLLYSQPQTRKYLREFCERTPPPFNRNYESLNFFSPHRPGSSASSHLFHTLSLSFSLFFSFSRSCCILLLFTIISSGRILLCIFLSSVTSFLVLLYN